MLLLSIGLTAFGEAQRDAMIHHVVAKYGFIEHPLPEDYAVTTFLAYGISAPAWLLAVNALSFISFDPPFFSSVVVMWFVIGLILDINAARGDRHVWKAIRAGCALYGLLLCYSAWKYYFSPPWHYPRFFIVPVTLWGLTLIFEGVYPFLSNRKKVWYRVISTFLIVSAIFDFEAASRLYNFRTSFGMTTIVFLFVWGLILLGCSIYLFAVSDPRIDQAA
jgi:hypothetical protein